MLRERKALQLPSGNLMKALRQLSGNLMKVLLRLSGILKKELLQLSGILKMREQPWVLLPSFLQSSVLQLPWELPSEGLWT